MAMNKQYTPENYSYGMDHEYVDLGLSAKWATCNLGAYLPEELGDYFAFGEIKAGKIDLEVYQSPPVDNIAGSDRDMARTNWGAPGVSRQRKSFRNLSTAASGDGLSKEVATATS